MADFGCSGSVSSPSSAHERHFVRIDLEAGIRARYVVGDDEVDAFLALLASRACDDIGCLGGKADKDGPLAAGALLAELRKDVRRPRQRKREGVRVLMDLLLRRGQPARSRQPPRP